jgi:hypothetical protein
MDDLVFLIHRYVEDCTSLSPDELDELIAALRADPELAASLYEQLWLDDLLAQKLTLDRRNFVAQVEQRIADLSRGQETLHRQVADLSSMAAAEKPGRFWGRRQWWSVAAALSLAAAGAIGGGVYLAATWERHEPTVATVKEVTGPVTVGEGSDAAAAEVDTPVERGQRIVVPRGGSVTLQYGERAKIQVKGDSEIALGAEDPPDRSIIRIERGEVVASIAPPLGERTRFVTPHAVALATTGQLRLVVTPESTLLDVSEGQVKFDRLTDNRSIIVAASESGLASRDTLQIRQLMWPDRRDGLAYLFSPLETRDDGKKPLSVARHPETRDLRVTTLEPRGDATLLESPLFVQLNGGYLISHDAGPDIFRTSRGGSELTLEAVFCPANLTQEGPARIVALADENDSADFALAQEGCDVTFSLRTDAAPTPPAPPRLTISSADTPLHLTVTYRHGELIVYRDGMEIARSKDLWGSLAAWNPGPLTFGADAGGERPWRGILEAFALYNRCLEPGEVARNARNYRLLAGRGM